MDLIAAAREHLAEWGGLGAIGSRAEVAQGSTLDNIIDRVHRRHERYETLALAELPNPAELHEDAILGTFSYTLQSSSVRLVRSDILISLDGTAETPPALARDYLTTRFGKASKIRWPQLTRLKVNTRPLPLYAKPCRFREGAYVDIQAAYWSILAATGWNVDYYPGRWLLAGDPVSDFPFQGSSARHKLARVSLVSSALHVPMSRWSAGRREVLSVDTGNKLINSQLVGAVRDTLHAIAWEARRAGAVYVATDGYICPDYRSIRAVCEAVRSWGLEPRIKGHGNGAVYGPGSYMVGPMHSRTPHDRLIPADNMREGEYDGWLKPRFSALVSRNKGA